MSKFTHQVRIIIVCDLGWENVGWSCISAGVEMWLLLNFTFPRAAAALHQALSERDLIRS